MEEPNLTHLFLSVRDMTIPECITLPCTTPRIMSVLEEKVSVHSVNELNNLESSVKLSM